MDIHSYTHINTLHRDAQYPVTVTGVLLDKKHSLYSLLQVNADKRLILMDMNLLNMIDLDEVDFDQENLPTGPCTGISQGMFFWRNATTTLLLLGEAAKPDNTLIAVLSAIDFEQEVNK